MPLSRSLLVFTLSALSVVFLAGCGGKTSVTGTVTFDGKPVDGGGITFFASGAREPAASGRIVDGKYSIPATEKLSAGVYRVEINWLKGTGKKTKNESDPGTESEETAQVIPAEYNTASKLSFEIKSGSNTANFDLKGGGPVTPGGTAPTQQKKDKASLNN